MPIVQLRHNDAVIKSVAMKTPKKVQSLEHWMKEAMKALKRPPMDLPPEKDITVTPSSIIFYLSDGSVEIDRTKNSMGY